MNHGFCFLSVRTVFLSAAIAATARAGGPVFESYDPHRLIPVAVRTDIRVDGDLSEWDGVEPTLHINTNTFEMNPPPIVSDADCSAWVRFAWDGVDTLYVAARVRDQSLVPLKKPGDMPWTCDGLIVSLQAYGALRDRSRTVQTTRWAEHPVFGLSVYDEATGPRQWTENTRYVVRPTADGYAIEAALSLGDVSYEARHGDRIKLALILVDHDEDGKFAQLTQKGDVLGPQRFAFWYDLRLRDERPYAGEIVCAQAVCDRLAEPAFTGQIDAFEEGLRLRSVRLQDADGRVLAEGAVDAPLPEGRRTRFAGRFPEMELAPGLYRLVAVVDRDGAEHNGAVHTEFEVAASREAAAALAERFPPHHNVPDPKRYAFPSDRRTHSPRSVTRQDYIELVRNVSETRFAYFRDQGREANLGIWGVFRALPFYALFRHTQDPRWLEAGLGLIRHAHEDNRKGTPAIFWPEQHAIVRLYLDDPSISDEDKAWLAEYTPTLVRRVWASDKPREWGAMNRSLMWAFLLDIGADALPDHPDAERWKTYADLIWEAWWPYRDHDENASDYNGAALGEYLSWALYRDPAHGRDAGLLQLFERELFEVTPSGATPGYGDSAPWNGSCWHRLALFEEVASLTGDGRFKWAARRLFEYAVAQMDDLFSWSLIADHAATACAWAYLKGDDSIAEIQPEMRSRITHRKRVLKADDALRQRLLEEHGITGVFLALDSEEQLNKLILRAGADPFAPAAMIELCSDAGHHASTVPNLNFLMHERAVLLCDLAYTERGPEYHNVILIEDLTGIAPVVREEIVTVPVMDAGPHTTYASVNVENYKGWPVTNNRRVLFTHEGLVLVKDLVTFHEPFIARVRQQWQTRVIGPQSGEHWVNTHIPWIVNTGLGLGHGFQRWLNPAWDLLIYFTPQPGRDHELYDRTAESIWQALPLRVSQRYRGLPPRDEPLHFTTLLWPHKPVPDVAEAYASKIAVLEDRAQVTVMRVDLRPNQTLILGLNDPGREATFGLVRTDAERFWVRCNVSDGTLVPVHVWARSATIFEVDGRVCFDSEQARDWDGAPQAHETP